MKLLFSFLTFFVIILAFLFKPLSIYGLETYLSSLLETNVKVINLDISKLNLEASIKEKNNIAFIDVKHLYPLQLDFIFTGNADAFKVYHPLKAKSVLKGKLYYKDLLKVEGTLSAYGASSVIKVNEEPQDWSVKATIKDLNISKLQKDNNISQFASGKVNANINFHTSKDSNINISSSFLIIEKIKFKDVELTLTEVEDHIQAKAVFKAKDINYKSIVFNYYEDKKKFDSDIHFQYKKTRDVQLVLNGEHNKTDIKAQTNISIASSKINITNINYKLKTKDLEADIDASLKDIQNFKLLKFYTGLDLYGDLKTKGKLKYFDKKVSLDLNTKSFDGDLDFNYKDSHIKYNATNINLNKLLKLFTIQENIHSKMNTKGSYYQDILHVDLDTKNLKIDKTNIKDINLKLDGKLNNLVSILSLKSKYVDVNKSKILIKDLQDINISAKVSTPYLEKQISVNAKVLYSKDQINASINADSKEFKLNIKNLKYKDSVVKAKYTALISSSLSRLKDDFNLQGNFSYDKFLHVESLSKSFGGNIRLSVKDKKIKLIANKIEVSKLLKQAHQKAYLDGKFNLEADGDFDNIDFLLKSDRLTLDKNETNFDENLSCLIKGTIDKKEIKLFSHIKNRHLEAKKALLRYGFEDKDVDLSFPIRIKNEKDNFKLLVEAKANISNDIKGDFSIKNRANFLHVENILYKNKILDADIKFLTSNLEPYFTLSKNKLYGPFAFNAKLNYKNENLKTSVYTNSLGGDLKIKLDKDILNIKAKDLEVKKIEKFIRKNPNMKAGVFNADINYDITNKLGKTNINVKNAILKGIDIDKKLTELKDMLGLNIFSISKYMLSKTKIIKKDSNLTTQIRHIEIDLDINDDIITSKDLAMSTQMSRFAINSKINVNGDIQNFNIAILDSKGCAIIDQELTGNIKDPKLNETEGAAVIILGHAPSAILDTGGKIVDAGAGLIDSTASFIWKKALRRDSKITLVNDTITKGSNVFAAQKDILVSGECTVFYNGKVKPIDQTKEIKQKK